ncbi:MAG: MFS transporter [Ardenticatenaceae bacterium]|nr:MFS transporter [Ardenticatenaceae bacterium]MCB9444799.1 MFS transporter [Ardenticatenaceae bacterium]
MRNPINEQPGAAVSARDLLKIRNFRLLWGGQIISNFGDAVTQLTLVLYINRLTGGDTQSIAWLLIALALPMATLGLVAGVFVDRWNRQRTMIISDLLRGILTLGFVAAAVWEQLWLIYVLAFLHATISSFFSPARGAVIPLVVPKEGLLAANSLSQTTLVFIRVLGTAVAGFLVGTLHTFTPAFLIDAATFFISALFIVRLILPETKVEESTAKTTVNTKLILAELSEGIKLIAASRILIGVMAAISITMLGLGAVNVLLAPMLVNEMGLPETWFGGLELAQTLGMILSGATITALAARFKPTSLISTSLIALGVILGFFAAINNIWQMFPALFIIGLTTPPVNAGISTILQTGVENQILGRVTGALHAVIQTSNLLSMFLAGVVAAAVGTRNVFLISGVIVVIAGLASAQIFRGYQLAQPFAAARQSTSD